MVIKSNYISSMPCTKCERARKRPARKNSKRCYCTEWAQLQTIFKKMYSVDSFFLHVILASLSFFLLNQCLTGCTSLTVSSCLCRFFFSNSRSLSLFPFIFLSFSQYFYWRVSCYWFFFVFISHFICLWHIELAYKNDDKNVI